MEIPDGDVLVHAGDFTMTGTSREIIQFNHVLGTLPHRYKVVIAGNHDWGFERAPGDSQDLMTNAHYLIDDELVVNGLRFWGSPWQPTFHNWAFNLEPTGIWSELSRTWRSATALGTVTRHNGGARRHRGVLYAWMRQ